MTDVLLTGSVIATCDRFEYNQQDAGEFRAAFGSGKAPLQAIPPHRPDHSHTRLVIDADMPEARRICLVPIEFLESLDERGIELNPCDLGEHLTLRGIDLEQLGRDTLLRIGADVVLSVAGLARPRLADDRQMPGLMNAVIRHTPDGPIQRGMVIAVALHGGIVRPADRVEVARPEGPRIPLQRI